ncbi:MAG: hypothetical protein IKL97_05560 [Eggerthellaceae bacterium]|nr:hypothetical protein [Eggerthellaceae bacterium]
MSNVNVTLNVLACLITSGEATDPLVETLEMRGIVDDARKINLFDGERGPRIFVETKEYLECDWDDLFADRDTAIRHIFNWVKTNHAKDARLSFSMASDTTNVAYKLHLSLEDRSSLRFRLEFDMQDARHPVFRKCEVRMRRANANYFLAPLDINGGMKHSPTAFLQCIRECAEYAEIQALASAIAEEGFVGHVCRIATNGEPWGEESYFDRDEWGEKVARSVYLATYGSERYEYEIDDEGNERATLRCGKHFKCLFKQKAGGNTRLRNVVFTGTATGKQAPKPAAAKASPASKNPKQAAVPKSSTLLKPAKEKAAAPSGKQDKDEFAGSTSQPKQKPGYRRVEIGEKDVLVRLETANYEAHRHATERVEISVEVKQPLGRTLRVPVTAYWCKSCKAYLLSPFAYNTLKGNGRFICCKVVKDGEMDSGGNLVDKRSTECFLAEESLLHSYGYNVGKKDSLTPAERRMILEFVVDRGIMNPARAIGFLQYLVDRAKSRKKADMSNAIHCWETDIRFLKELEKKR